MFADEMIRGELIELNLHKTGLVTINCINPRNSDFTSVFDWSCTEGCPLLSARALGELRVDAHLPNVLPEENSRDS